ncbi:MAG: CorA family divalent cation transporter [Pseudomonadota bacterium]
MSEFPSPSAVQGPPPMGVFTAVLISPDGTHRVLSPEQAFTVQPGEGLVWLHLDRRNEAVLTWLYAHSGIDEIDVEALLSEETRPRAYRPRQQASLMVILRGVNNRAGCEDDDLMSIRLWVEKHRVLSFSSRPMVPVEDVVKMLGGEYSPVNAAELLAALATRMVAGMEPAIDALRDTLDELEENMDAGRRIDLTRLMQVRRRGATLRRFLNPQKDVFVTIDSLHLPWLGITAEEEWREATNTLYRYIEDLEVVREGVQILQDGLNQRIVARANRTFYAVSVVAAFFVPLTFTTGLLGMNVGGIPGSQSPWGFAGVIAFLVSWSVIQYLVFRRLRWL